MSIKNIIWTKEPKERQRWGLYFTKDNKIINVYRCVCCEELFKKKVENLEEEIKRGKEEIVKNQPKEIQERYLKFAVSGNNMQSWLNFPN